MKQRNCFKCNRELSYSEFKTTNSDLEEDTLKKLWSEDRIQFYCCRCYFINNSQFRNLKDRYVVLRRKNYDFEKKLSRILQNYEFLVFSYNLIWGANPEKRMFRSERNFKVYLSEKLEFHLESLNTFESINRKNMEIKNTFEKFYYLYKDTISSIQFNKAIQLSEFITLTNKGGISPQEFALVNRNLRSKFVLGKIFEVIIVLDDQ